jgi:DEAD/DEAH box helicase domain-containing protein
VDQYLTRHPEALFGHPKERLGLDPDNLVILSEQIKCAAFELPFREDASPGTLDDPAFGGVRDAAGILDYLAEESRLLLKRGDTWHWMADAYPAQDVTLGGDDPDNVLVLDVETKKAIGEIDRAWSITTVHEGAIYQVQGETWKVERFDYKNRRAYVRAVESDYFTEAETDVSVRVLRLEERKERTRADAPVTKPVIPVEHDKGGEDHSVWRGEVHVTTVATQYKKVRFYTRESVGAEDIHLPAEELDTEAFVLTLSDAAACELGLTGGDRGAAWRGVGAILRRVAPLWLRCQPSDLGLSTQVRSPHFDRPAIYVYDSVQGGVGLATILFQSYRDLVRSALEVVARCACVNGCPGCIGPVEEVGPLGKEVALRVLSHLASGPDPLPRDVQETEPAS